MNDAPAPPTPDQPAGSTALRPYLPWAGSWWAIGGLIALLLLARLAYLAWVCPYALIEDEAHYWEWSNRLGWSYYSKGPGIAWTIALSSSVLGDTEFGVRASAAVFGALASLAVAGFAYDIWRDRRAGFVAVVLFNLVHVFQATSLMMTIDMPYFACWALACWAACRALEGRSNIAWPALGLALGVGFLFKYTILLLVPALLLHAALRRRRLETGSKPWASLGLGLVAMMVGFGPVLMWNATQGWPTVAHLLGHLGVVGGDVAVTQGGDGGWTYDWRWTAEMVGLQLLIVGPGQMLLLWYAAGQAWKRRRDDPQRWPRQQLAFVCGVPILVFYVLVTFATEGEGNWPVAGYVSLVALASGSVVEAMEEFRHRVAAWKAKPEPRPREGILRAKPELHRQIAWHVALGTGLIVGAVTLRVDLLRHVPALGPHIPVGRLTSARAVAAEARALADRLEGETGLPAFFVAQHYGRASLLAFYARDGRPVLCSSSYMAGRQTQYDYWDDTDPRDVKRFGGRPAVLMGATREQWLEWFERIEVLEGGIPGDHKSDRLAALGFGYRGPPPASSPAPHVPADPPPDPPTGGGS